MPKLRATGDNILCTDADFGDHVTESGIVIKSTMGQSQGITPRWFRVFEVGPEIEFLNPGQWVLVEYGRWADGISVQDERFDTDDNIKEVWKIDPAGCLVIADEKPNTLNYNSDVIATEKKAL